MNFLERYSINSYSDRTIPDVLRRGIKLLSEETRAEIGRWVVSQQTSEGGFPDRSGRCDLYYTLFGLFLAEALEAATVFPLLKEYAGKMARVKDHKGIDLYCTAILVSSLFPGNADEKRYKRAIRKMIKERSAMEDGYTPFLVILALLSLHDHFGAIKVLNIFEKTVSETESPCPVVAARQMVAWLKTEKSGTTDPNVTPSDASLTGPFHQFYRPIGGFAALKNTRDSDLLSTAVALFVLRLMNYDLRTIKPDCFEFISGLYHDGGFAAVTTDNVADVEYTFYGLLALGALSSSDDKN